MFRTSLVPSPRRPRPGARARLMARPLTRPCTPRADAGGEADALPGPEQELRKIIAEQSMKQFMERSQELAQETKKNLEG